MRSPARGQLSQVPTRAPGRLFHTVIDTPRGSPVKCKYDPESGLDSSPWRTSFGALLCHRSAGAGVPARNLSH